VSYDQVVHAMSVGYIKCLSVHAGAVRRLLGDCGDVESRLPSGWFTTDMLRVGFL
jgi:hypothetical protein